MDITDLSAATRETLFQFRVDGLRPRDVSDELNIPESRARDRLRVMESRGLIEKRIMKSRLSGKRAKRTDYWLTNEGARVLAELREIYQPQP